MIFLNYKTQARTSLFRQVLLTWKKKRESPSRYSPQKGCVLFVANLCRQSLSARFVSAPGCRSRRGNEAGQAATVGTRRFPILTNSRGNLSILHAIGSIYRQSTGSAPASPSDRPALFSPANRRRTPHARPSRTVRGPPPSSPPK